MEREINPHSETHEQESLRHRISVLTVRAFVHTDEDSLIARQELEDMGVDIKKINAQSLLKSQIVTEILTQLETKDEK